ncbi:anti-sigma factor [Actinoplanes sp. NPDC024001]|uniref:anti-sigma factor n=1 Tax=Actinoplanes sp. NPDC024001 TaxID=3154598 RepID=UPI0033C5A889
MQHLDTDRLVLLALSEESADPGEAVHLHECADCRREFEELREVADLGTELEDVRDLPAPPDRVWRAIEERISPAPAYAEVVDLARHRERPARPRRRRWPAAVMAAVAAAVVAVAGTVVAIRVLQPSPADPITAQATLNPLPTVPPAAHGTAEVLAGGEMRLDVRNLPLTTGFHQVWLIDPDDTTKMVSLGNLPDGPQVVLPVPPGTDLHRYRLVDVSDEAHDGDAAHSGNSLLRGMLTG